jgi:hypothetical protein
MSQKVKGYLSSDGRFFETGAECKRHEHAQTLIESCDSHGINVENFFMLLREWHEPIKGYYDADSRCQQKEVVANGGVKFDSPDELSQSEDNHQDAPIRDKDTPGFLEQQIRRRV